MVEVLAHHYSRTNYTNKAFIYLTGAGTKSLSVYSLDEAATHFSAAHSLLNKNPDCASDDQVINFLLSYSSQLDYSGQVNRQLDLLARYLARIDRLGDDPRVVLVRVVYAIALFVNARYRQAAAMQREASPMADRLGDVGSKAWTLATEILVTSIVEPKPLHEFEMLKAEAIKAASDMAEAIIQRAAATSDYRGLCQALDLVCDRSGRVLPRAHQRCSRCGSRAHENWSASKRSPFHQSRLVVVVHGCSCIGIL